MSGQGAFRELCPRSCTEALPPAWDERDGVYSGYSHPPDQGWPRLRPESPDQRTSESTEDCAFECMA